jgi:nucleoside 2-deoxyribosyltransferase
VRVYLGGPINGCTDDEAHGWRDDVKQLLEAHGFEWLDPMDRDYRGREMEPGIAAEIVELDKQDIDTCDVLLMNCPKPSVGTSMEILYGWLGGKQVYAVTPPGSIPSPWLVYHAHFVHEGTVGAAALGLIARETAG